MLSRGRRTATREKADESCTSLPLGDRIDFRQELVLAKAREAWDLPERPLGREPAITHLQETFQWKYVHADFKPDGGTQLAGGSTHHGYTPSKTQSIAADVIGPNNPRYFGAIAQYISERAGPPNHGNPMPPHRAFRLA